MDDYFDEVAEKNLQKIDELGPMFWESQYFKNLTEDQKCEAESVITSFSKHMYSSHGHFVDAP